MIGYVRMKTSIYNWCRLLLILFISWLALDLFLVSLSTEQTDTKWFALYTTTVSGNPGENSRAEYRQPSPDVNYGAKLAQWNKTQRLFRLKLNVSTPTRSSLINQFKRENTGMLN